MTHYLFTSEAVGIGHPDKMADQISDAIVDACYREDLDAKVACETLIGRGLIVLAGEITTSAHIDYDHITRQVVREIGYTDCSLGFDYRSCGIIVSIHKQSPDIAQGITEGEGLYKEQGAGDQGIMFGFACDETPELMPLPLMLSYQILDAAKEAREDKKLPYLRPDGKSQVTVEYNEKHEPVRVHTVVLSLQHSEEVTYEQVCKDALELIRKVIPNHLLDDKTIFHINPTGRFIIGGPAADCGVTGRKPIVDTYGGMGRHGGGAFSGKDATKVDRAAAYAGRYIAKNIVAAGLARRCELQVSYAIGVPYPISIKVDTFGSSTVSEELLSKVVPLVFDLTPKGIIDMLDLKRPIYQKTAYPGHFGQQDPDFTWEKTDRTEQLQEAIKAINCE